MDIDKQTLDRLLTYNPDTGEFRWRERPVRDGFEFPDKTWNSRQAGKVAGNNTSRGYRSIGIAVSLGDVRRIMAHRAAWIMHYGEIPKSGIDHINGNRSDNRIVNLRLASQVENLANVARRKDNTSGASGVSYQKARGMWRARLNLGGKQVFYGYYATKDEAVAARAEASKRIRGHFCPILSRGVEVTSKS